MKTGGSYLKSCFKNEKGGILILVVVLMVVLLGMTALVIDVGGVFVTRRQMVAAADAAALAGAQEMVLSGSESAAIAIAESFARTNGAEIINRIAIEERTYNEESIKVVVADVGKNEELFFAKILGFFNQNVDSYAVATWGFPKRYGKFLPIFYVIEEGFDLPEGEQVLLGEKLTPGNWGFLDVGQGQSGIDTLLKGNDYEVILEIGDEITNDTKTGDANSRIKAVEERMQKAHAAKDPGIMDGIIPILREITGQGKTEVVIVGFAPFCIDDVITAITKEDEKKWYGLGSTYALLPHSKDYPVGGYTGAPKLYGEGFDKQQDIAEFYPRAGIIGHFLAEKFLLPYEVEEFTQDPDYDYGLYVVKLIE